MIGQFEREELDYEFSAMYDRYDGWRDQETYREDFGLDEINNELVGCLVVDEYSNEQDAVERADAAWFQHFTADDLPF